MVKGASVSKTNTLGSISKKIPKARPVAKTDINAKGIKKIKSHLAKMDPDKANEVMIKRLEKIASGELKPTKTDLRFYTHELREQKLMKMGMTYEEAHAQALKDYNGLKK